MNYFGKMEKFFLRRIRILIRVSQTIKFLLALFVLFSFQPFAGAQFKLPFYGQLQKLVSPTRFENLISDHALSEVKFYGDKLISEYPPSDWIYVGIGRSPTVILAYLDGIKPIDSAIETIHLPLSVRGYKEGQTGTDEYIGEYLTAATPKTAKKILFIDYSSSGESISILSSILLRFFQRPYALSVFASPEVLRRTNTLPFAEGVLLTGSCFDTNGTLSSLFCQESTDFLNPYKSLKIVEQYKQSKGERLPQATRSHGDYNGLVSWMRSKLNRSISHKCESTFN